MAYQIKNWHKFQHFKERKPIWIKLYRDILDDYQWHELDGQSAKILVMLWLIASENDGKITSLEEASWRMRLPLKDLQQSISKLYHWIEQDDNSLISSVYQDDPLEKRREETEKRQRREDSCTETKPRLATEPPLVTFSTDGTVKEFHVTQSMIDKFDVAYPALDILSEIQRAKSWVDSNPSRKKTANGMPKFLNSWLGRAQDGMGTRKATSNPLHINASEPPHRRIPLGEDGLPIDPIDRMWAVACRRDGYPDSEWNRWP